MAKSASSTESTSGFLDDAEESLTEFYEGAESWIEEKLEVTRERVRDEPIKSLLISAAVGAILARLFL